MKLSNNAIKFLMAQYRAIYKNAYFKGIATAVVLTSALAAGQAQAAENAVFGTNKVTDKTITSIEIDGKQVDAAANNLPTYTSINIVDQSVTNDWLDVKVTSGTAASNLIQASGANATLTVKNLEIAADAAAKGIKVEASGAFTAKVNALESVTLTKGTIELVGKAQASSQLGILATPKINFNAAAATDAVLSLGDSGSVVGNGAAVATNGTVTNATLLNFEKAGTIKFSGTNAADAVLNGQFSGAGEAVIDFGAKKGTIKAFGTLDNATIKVGAAGAGTLELTNVDGTSVDESTLKINKGGINISAADGKFIIKQGTLELGDEATITPGATLTGGVEVGTASTYGTLKIKKENLETFLNPKGASGAILVSGSGSLMFTGTDPVDLSGLSVSGALTAGVIAAKDGAKIGAENVTVYSALSDGQGQGAAASTATIVALNTLTLGNGSDASDTYKVKGFEAKNLTLKAGLNETAFKLADSVTLASTKDIGLSKDGKKMLGAGTGLISGDALNLSGSAATTALTITAGNYETIGQNITLNKGVLAVTSAADNTVDIDGKKTGIESSLVIKGGTIKVVNDNTPEISVSGDKATLDLREATLQFTKSGTAANAGILAKGGGNLLISQNNFDQFAITADGKNGYFGIQAGTVMRHNGY